VKSGQISRGPCQEVWNLTKPAEGTAGWASAINQNFSDIETEAANPAQSDFRLSVVSGTPVPTTDQVGAGTLYLTSLSGKRVALYDGSAWKMRETAEVSLALASLTSGKNYDLFAYWTGSAVALELSAAWTNDTTRADAVTRQDGVWCKSGALTRRLVGTIRTTGTSTTEDSAAKRFVWNASNRVRRMLRRDGESTQSWSYSSTTVRQANANSANQVEAVFGLAEDPVEITAASSVAYVSNQVTDILAGVGVDSTTVNSAQITPPMYSDSGWVYAKSGYYMAIPSIGYHYYAWLEACAHGSPVGTYTFYGRISHATWTAQCGLHGSCCS